MVSIKGHERVVEYQWSGHERVVSINGHKIVIEYQWT